MKNGNGIVPKIKKWGRNHPLQAAAAVFLLILAAAALLFFGLFMGNAKDMISGPSNILLYNPKSPN